jgi:hypothetical protein
MCVYIYIIHAYDVNYIYGIHIKTHLFKYACDSRTHLKYKTEYMHACIHTYTHT